MNTPRIWRPSCRRGSFRHISYDSGAAVRAVWCCLLCETSRCFLSCSLCLVPLYKVPRDTPVQSRNDQMMSRRAGRLEPQNPAQLSLLTGVSAGVRLRVSLCQRRRQLNRPAHQKAEVLSLPSTRTDNGWVPVCLHVAVPHPAQHHGPRWRRQRRLIGWLHVGTGGAPPQLHHHFVRIPNLARNSS